LGKPTSELKRPGHLVFMYAIVEGKGLMHLLKTKSRKTLVAMARACSSSMKIRSTEIKRTEENEFPCKTVQGNCMKLTEAEERMTK